MSNARSPREVCSTTIGTSGLMILASFASCAGFLPTVATGSQRPPRGPGSSAPRRPDLLWLPFGALFAGRPELLASLRLIDADGARLPDEHLDRLTVGDVLAQRLETAGLAQLLHEISGVRSVTLGRRAQRLDELAVRGLDLLGGDDRGEHGLAPELSLIHISEPT